MNRTLRRENSQNSAAGIIAIVALAAVVMLGMYLTGVKVW